MVLKSIVLAAAGWIVPLVARFEHGPVGLRAGQQPQFQAVVHHRRHLPPAAFQPVQEVVAKRQQHLARLRPQLQTVGQIVAFIAARIEAGGRFSTRQASDSRKPRTSSGRLDSPCV